MSGSDLKTNGAYWIPIQEKSIRLTMTRKFLFIVIQFSASTTRTYIHSFIGKFTVTIMRRVGLFSVSRSPIRAVVIFALPRRIWESYGYLLIKMDYIRLTCHLSRLKTIINLSLNMTTAHCEHFMWTRKGIFCYEP